MIERLRALFSKEVAEGRPDLVALLGLAPGEDVLVVDGETDGWSRLAADFDGAAVLRHTSEAETGLPLHERDPRRLPPREGGYAALVLVDVLDRVIDPAHSLRAAAESLAPGGRMLLLQTVAPDDFDARAAWNVLARLREPQQTWTPSRRQARAMAAGSGLCRGDEQLWAETVDVLAGTRHATADLLGLFAESLEADFQLIESGRLSVTRMALLLESG